MKLISWNVNGLRACVQKGFADIFLKRRMRTSSVSRRQSCRRDRSTWRPRVIISTGTML